MDTQMTNIAIKVGEIGIQASVAIVVAVLGAIASLICAIISGMLKIKLDKTQQQYQKQWAFIGKKTVLFDAAIEVCARMIWNKLLMADNVLVVVARNNLFLLQKECLVLETQLFLYGDKEIAGALADFKNKIISIPDSEFRKRWSEIIEEGRKQLGVLKNNLGISVAEDYKSFTDKLIPPEVTSDFNLENIKEIGSKFK